MDFKQLFDDDRAVSPVIGVILMVAITVILAAVIGTFVLGLGDQVQSTTPQASFGFDTAEGQKNVTITHESGDSIEASSVKITSNQAFNYSADNTANVNEVTWSDATDDSEVSAGASVELGAMAAGSGVDFSGDTVRVVYDSPDSDTTSTIGKFEVP